MRDEISEYCKQTRCSSCVLAERNYCAVLIDRYGDAKIKEMYELVKGAKGENN